MKCTQLICAQYTLTDKGTNQVSIINILENVFSSLFPFQIPQLSLFASFEKEQGDTIEISPILKISLNDTLLFSQPLQVTFIEPDPRNNTTINMQGLVISNSGELSFKIEYNKTDIKSTSIKISLKG